MNLRITAKRHAHLQTLIKTSAMAKTVGGVAFTGLRDGQSDGRTDRRTHGENIMSPESDGRSHKRYNGKVLNGNDERKIKKK